MCQHHILAQNQDGIITWCPECKVYNLQFNNIIMTFDTPSFQQFKENISNCYLENTSSGICCKKRHCKDILFETKLEGMRLCFSVNDIGSLLILMQEAALMDYGRRVMES